MGNKKMAGVRNKDSDSWALLVWAFYMIVLHTTLVITGKAY